MTIYPSAKKTFLFFATSVIRIEQIALPGQAGGTIGPESSSGALPSPRPEPAPATALESARAIADGWVTPGRPALVIGRAPSEGLCSPRTYTETGEAARF